MLACAGFVRPCPGPLSRGHPSRGWPRSVIKSLHLPGWMTGRCSDRAFRRHASGPLTPGASIRARPTIATTAGKAFIDDAGLNMLNDQRLTTSRRDRADVVDQASRPYNANSPESVGTGSAGAGTGDAEHKVQQANGRPHATREVLPWPGAGRATADAGSSAAVSNADSHPVYRRHCAQPRIPVRAPACPGQNPGRGARGDGRRRPGRPPSPPGRPRSRAGHPHHRRIPRRRG
jgi:hypothetical protein